MKVNLWIQLLMPNIYIYNKGKIFNFGYYQVKKDPLDGKPHFISEIRGIDGFTRPGSHLDLTPK